MSPPPLLDHLILLLPCSTTSPHPSIPPSLSQLFTLHQGGPHTDLLTSNTLIPLADASYIELITFLAPDAAKTHWWGPDVGDVRWLDWCLTTTTAAAAETHASLGAVYAEPVKGGRQKPNGERVAWEVLFPRGEMGGRKDRGRVPFFCHDVTPREVRVPGGSGSESGVVHSSGVLGVKGFTVIVADWALLEETKLVYEAVLREKGVGNGDESVHFSVGRVRAVQGLEDRAVFTLRLPGSESERERTVARGFVFGDVVLGAKARVDKPVGTKERVDGPGKDFDLGGLWIEYL